MQKIIGYVEKTNEKQLFCILSILALILLLVSMFLLKNTLKSTQTVVNADAAGLKFERELKETDNISNKSVVEVKKIKHKEEAVKEVVKQPVERSEPKPTIKTNSIAELAASQVGYVPDTSNVTKYHADLGVSQGQDWCGFFVQWCLTQSGNADKVVPGAGLASSWAEYGAVHSFNDEYAPKAGDVVTFDRDGNESIDHVGLVKEFKDGTLYTIEGNTYVPGYDNYGVWERSYDSWTYIYET